MSLKKYGIEKKDLIMPASILIGAILISTSVLFSAGKITWSGNESGSVAVKTGDTQTAPSEEVKLAVRKDAPSIGSGKVEIVEFSDFQCPFCSRFHPVIEQVLAAYPGKVSYVIKHFPLQFHPQAKPAVKAIFAAGEQGKYWEMVDLILKDNRDVSDAKLEEYAKQLNLNMKKFGESFADKDGKFEKLIQTDIELAGKTDVRGTPTFYINGKKTMARDLDSFKREIDAILNKK